MSATTTSPQRTEKGVEEDRATRIAAATFGVLAALAGPAAAISRNTDKTQKES